MVTRSAFRMRFTHNFFVVSLLFFLAIVAFPASAELSPLQRMEGLVMPGEVIKKHARVEKQCDKCHEAFDRTKQNKQCMECHKEIAKDIKQQRGYHGKIIGVSERECRTCHTDHKGRDADIVQLDLELFDHDKTEFKLAGAHKSTECKDCHKKVGVYRQPEKICIDCHEKDDPHKERMGKKCENCHIEGAWLPARFDHSKTF